MENVKIYLSGFDDQSKWRQQLQDAIKFGDYDYSKKPLFFDPTQYYRFEKERHKSDREIMEFDLHNLRNSDLVIVNFNDPKNIGTASELAIAKELHIPIIGINTNNQELHPWLVEFTTRMCDSLREAVEHVIDFYLN